MQTSTSTHEHGCLLGPQYCNGMCDKARSREIHLHLAAGREAKPQAGPIAGELPNLLQAPMYGNTFPTVFRTSALDDTNKTAALELTLTEPIVVIVDYPHSSEETRVFDEIQPQANIGNVLVSISYRSLSSKSSWDPAPSRSQLQLLETLPPNSPWGFLLPRKESPLIDTLDESHSVSANRYLAAIDFFTDGTIGYTSSQTSRLSSIYQGSWKNH